MRACFGAAGFLAAASAGVAGAVVGAGRGDGKGAFATGDDDAGARGADGVVADPGSGVMMLIGGVEAAVGNSALVGFPDGIADGSVATAATGTDAAAGAFHDGA